MPRNPRVALCFFGKHGDDAGPSRAMLPNATASTPILRASFASWRDRVVLANPMRSTASTTPAAASAAASTT